MSRAYSYANDVQTIDDPNIGNTMRRILEAFSTFEFKEGIDTVSCNKTALKSLAPHADYFENLMYRLVLNGESHFEQRIKGLEDLNFFSVISPEEKHQTAKDIICLMYILNPNHVNAHLAEIPAEVKKQKKQRQAFRPKHLFTAVRTAKVVPAKKNVFEKEPAKNRWRREPNPLYVNKNFLHQREEMERRITTEEGCLLRVNRSIQAEGSFAMTKEDMRFRRILTRGKYNVTVEWLLLCFAYNVCKLDHKAKTDRLGTHLIIPIAYVA